ncbi:hypothetical protein QTH90_30155 [Variovorax sp. J2P1-59]|uniref:hypothetical protein n=1 Tax=Variovorax flavidus TaxID=3053501 RepID=UPI0025754377|nr:hypothetical protein [Variovorax sp. J2P1-59]MDM0078705.1 hypothetical protein [Variovorax sp. J2P1-59]
MNAATILLSLDEQNAHEYRSQREWKKWAVHVVAGPARKPTYKRTAYVRARTSEAAISLARRDLIPLPPRSARFGARLAGPHELGCVLAPAATASDAAPDAV